MKTLITLSQEEVANIIAATLGYNGIEAQDVTFDVSTGELSVVVTTESQQLRVRQTPESQDYTDRLIERWRVGRS